MKKAIAIALAALLSIGAGAQQNDGIIRMFRPIYFITGVPLDGTSSYHTNDIKYQISISAPLWASIAGHEGLDLFVAYTQTSVWHFYDSSSPFKDNMYIPGIYFDIPLKSNNILIGAEHRSNGRPYRDNREFIDNNVDHWSRSINYAFVEYTHSFPCGISLQVNGRAGFGWYDTAITQDLFSMFFGYASFTALYESPDGRFDAMLSATPIFKPFGLNSTAEVSWKPFKYSYCPRLFVQAHYGYDEAMIDWIRGSYPSPYIRGGLMLSPGGFRRMSR